MIRTTLIALALCLAACGVDGEPEPPKRNVDVDAAVEDSAEDESTG